MQFRTLRRTTTFRLTLIYAIIFAVGTAALLAVIYVQSVVYLTRRVDGILQSEADALVRSPRPGLRERIIEDLALNGGTTGIFALFTKDGIRIAGNLDTLPPGLEPGQSPREVPATRSFPESARLIVRRLPSGELLVVGRDVHQMREMRSIIGSALTWGGVSIIIVGLACGISLSIGPLRRLRELQAAGDAISQGDLKRRMPTSRHRDELDLFAATVNHMMDEVERLMSEVQGATDIIAHDLLMPLTRARTRLSRILQSSEWDMEQAARVGEEIDGVLDRFRAILRISQMDIRDRRAGFASIDLNDIVAPVAELYEPLAEAAGVTLSLVPATVTKVHADPKLMVEALSNLVDNAIKFTRSGGNVRIELLQAAGHPRIIVEDDGPGISPDERGEFMQKFRSVKRTSTVPGSGIGLSVVAAIVRLHGFRLRLQDGAPGLRAVIDCGNAESPPEAVGAREG